MKKWISLTKGDNPTFHNENSAVQQITNNNLVVIALDSLSVTKLKEMTSYLKGAYV